VAYARSLRRCHGDIVPIVAAQGRRTRLAMDVGPSGAA
jgi:hypothetical protein